MSMSVVCKEMRAPASSRCREPRGILGLDSLPSARGLRPGGHMLVTVQHTRRSSSGAAGQFQVQAMRAAPYHDPLRRRNTCRPSSGPGTCRTTGCALGTGVASTHHRTGLPSIHSGTAGAAPKAYTGAYTGASTASPPGGSTTAAGTEGVEAMPSAASPLSSTSVAGEPVAAGAAARTRRGARWIFT